MKGLEEQLLGRVINTEKEVKRSLYYPTPPVSSTSLAQLRLHSPRFVQIVETTSLILKELEAERVKLMEDVTTNKRKMKELEDNLLYRLTSTQVSFVLISFCVGLIQKYWLLDYC